MADQIPFRLYQVKLGQELRMIVDPNSKVRVWLIQGDVDVFGTELKRASRKDRRHHRHHHRSISTATPNDYDIKDSYTFCDCSIAFFGTSKTEHAQLLVQGTPTHCYVSDQV